MVSLLSTLSSLLIPVIRLDIIVAIYVTCFLDAALSSGVGGIYQVHSFRHFVRNNLININKAPISLCCFISLRRLRSLHNSGLCCNHSLYDRA